MELCKVNLDIGKLLIQCNRNCCCEHITGGVNIYLYWSVSVLTPVCVGGCVWNTQQGPPGVTMVPRIDMCKSMILSRVTHQMWRNHPLKQWNKATKRAVGVEDIGGSGCVGQNLKKEGRQYRGGIHKIVPLRTLCQLRYISS